MHNAREKFAEADVRIVGISYDDVKILKTFSDAQDLEITLLSDDGSKVIKAYDLLFQRGLPQPATILIGKDGKIQAKLSREGYRARHSVDELLEVASKIKS